MKFLSVRSDICRQLPSDSTSRWTPLPLTMQFPLLGLARDFHPLDNAHAERTTKRKEIITDFFPLFCCIFSYKTYGFNFSNFFKFFNFPFAKVELNILISFLNLYLVDILAHQRRGVFFATNQQHIVFLCHNKAIKAIQYS